MLEAGVTGDGDDRKRRFPFGKYPRLLMGLDGEADSCGERP